MRIAYLCLDPGVPVFGRKGCSIHVQEIIRGMVRRGDRVELFARRVGSDVPEDLATVPVHRLDCGSPRRGADREAQGMLVNRQLRELLGRLGPFDMVYERHSLFSTGGMEYAHETGVPGVLEVNAPLVEEQLRHRDLVNVAIAKEMAARAFAKAATLIAVSDGVAGYLNRFPQARGRVRVLPNGVDAVRFGNNVPSARPRRVDRFTIGFVGTLKPWHGVEDLLSAFALLRGGGASVELLIVGAGPERANLEQQARNSGVAQVVQFIGSVPHEKIPSWLAAMDVAVAPYPELPGFYFSPLKIYEYMAAGRAVVASRTGGLARLIRHRENGLLFPPGEVPALAAAIRQLHGEPELLARLGRAARETAVREHTWAARVERIMQLAGAGLAAPRRQEEFA